MFSSDVRQFLFVAGLFIGGKPAPCRVDFVEGESTVRPLRQLLASVFTHSVRSR